MTAISTAGRHKRFAFNSRMSVRSRAAPVFQQLVSWSLPCKQVRVKDGPLASQRSDWCRHTCACGTPDAH